MNKQMNIHKLEKMAWKQGQGKLGAEEINITWKDKQLAPLEC